MDIYEVIEEKFCKIGLKAKTKDDCLKEMASFMRSEEDPFSENDLFKALKAREAKGSTGFENGIAIPHATLDGISNFRLGIAVFPKGVHYESLDKKKTFLFFILIGPQGSAGDHLKFLAQISMALEKKATIDELKNAASNLALREQFLRHVSQDGDNGQNEQSFKNKLVMFILSDLDWMDEMMTIFLDYGIRGANVMESSGMKNALSNIPMFGDFLNFLGEESNESKTIITIMPENQVERITKTIENKFGNLDTHTGIQVIALDLFFYKGSMEML